jgi:hypothetical protein
LNVYNSSLIQAYATKKLIQSDSIEFNPEKQVNSISAKVRRDTNISVATMRRKSVIAIKSPNTLNQTHRGRRRREERGVNVGLEQPVRVVVEIKVLELAEIGDRRRRTEERATHAGAGNGAARGKNWWRAAAQNNIL